MLVLVYITQERCRDSKTHFWFVFIVLCLRCARVLRDIGLFQFGSIVQLLLAVQFSLFFGTVVIPMMVLEPRLSWRVLRRWVPRCSAPSTYDAVITTADWRRSWRYVTWLRLGGDPTTCCGNCGKTPGVCRA